VDDTKKAAAAERAEKQAALD
jgi:chromosome segregation ATPase